MVLVVVEVVWVGDVVGVVVDRRMEQFAGIYLHELIAQAFQWIFLLTMVAPLPFGRYLIPLEGQLPAMGAATE